MPTISPTIDGGRFIGTTVDTAIAGTTTAGHTGLGSDHSAQIALAIEPAWERTLQRSPTARNRVLLLLLLVAGWEINVCLGDSPKWADEQMRFIWPAALNDSPLPAVVASPTVPWGHSSLADDGVRISTTEGGPMETAQWSVPRLTDPPTTWNRPTSALDALTTVRNARLPCDTCDDWHFLPAGLLYGSYIAGEKEPRMAAAFLNERDRGSVFEATIGGRLGFVRYGTPGPVNPQGWQWDLEGAAMLRQDPEQELDVEATDFRVGSVLTWRRGSTAMKAGYYHLSSHLGDEFLLRNPLFPRLNYLRDALLIGVYRNISDNLSVYGEVAYAFNTDGGAEPLELQFGAEFTPFDSTRSSGAPFAAVNGHLREEFEFGGSVNVLAGWQWRGPNSNRRLRIGGQYYNGKEIQWSSFDESVQFFGGGIWYDF